MVIDDAVANNAIAVVAISPYWADLGGSEIGACNLKNRQRDPILS